MLELNKVYNIDCREGFIQLKDESIDLIVTSPPYKEEDGYTPELMQIVAEECWLFGWFGGNESC